MSAADDVEIAVRVFLQRRAMALERSELTAERDRAYARLVHEERLAALEVSRRVCDRLRAEGVPEAELSARWPGGVSHDAVSRGAKRFRPT